MWEKYTRWHAYCRESRRRRKGGKKTRQRRRKGEKEKILRLPLIKIVLVQDFTKYSIPKLIIFKAISDSVSIIFRAHSVVLHLIPRKTRKVSKTVKLVKEVCYRNTNRPDLFMHGWFMRLSVVFNSVYLSKKRVQLGNTIAGDVAWL